MNYQNMYYPNMMQPQQTTNNQPLNWVQGETGAKSWMVGRGETVLLMDAEGDKFYLKSTDGAGIPTLRTFEYKEIHQNIPKGLNGADKTMNDQFVTRTEYDALLGKIEALSVTLEDMQRPKTRKKEVVADE